MPLIFETEFSDGKAGSSGNVLHLSNNQLNIFKKQEQSLQVSSASPLLGQYSNLSFSNTNETVSDLNSIVVGNYSDKGRFAVFNRGESDPLIVGYNYYGDPTSYYDYVDGIMSLKTEFRTAIETSSPFIDWLPGNYLPPFIDTFEKFSIEGLFKGMSNVRSLDLTLLDFSNVISFKELFSGCLNLKEIIFDSNLSTSKVTTMEGMCYNCQSLSSIDVSKFYTRNLAIADRMFYNCLSLKYLNLESWNISAITSASEMFYGLTNAYGECAAANIDWFSELGYQYEEIFFAYAAAFYNSTVSNGVATISLTTGFKAVLSSLTLDSFSNWSKGKPLPPLPDADAYNLTSLFASCIGLTSFVKEDYSSWDLSKVVNSSYMFQSCTGLQVVDLSNTNMPNLTTMAYMFRYCNSCTEINMSNMYLPNLTTVTAMFRNGYNSSVTSSSNSGLTLLEKIDFSNTVIGSETNLINLQGLLLRSPALKEVNLSNCKIYSADFSYIFYYCSSLQNIDLTGIDLSNLTTMTYAFYYCTDLQSIDLTDIELSNLTTMAYAFYYCNSLSLVDLSNMDLTNLTTMAYAFCYCTGLQVVDLSNTNMPNLTTMAYMLRSCNSCTEINMSNMYLPSLTTVTAMFRDGYSSSVTSSSNSGLALLEKIDFSNTIIGSEENSVSLQGLLLRSPALKEVNLSNCKIYSADFSYMFYYCSNLQSIDLSNAELLNLTTMAYMFYYCSNLQNIDLSNIELSNLTTMAYMFYYCSGLIEVKFFNNELPLATATYCYQYMFAYCSSLTSTLKFSPELTILPTYACRYMYYYCTSLIQLSEFSASLSTYCYYYMFRYCSALKISTTQSDTYQYEFKIPVSGDATSTPSGSVTNMFSNTGGSFTSTPSINTSYYTDYPILASTTD